MKGIEEIQRIYDLLNILQGTVMLKKTFEVVMNDSPQNLEVQTIQEYAHKKELAIILSQIPVPILGDAFGNDTLMWVLKNYQGKEFELYKNRVRLRLGVTPKKLEKMLQ